MTPDTNSHPAPGGASVPASRPDVGLPPEVLDTLERVKLLARDARRDAAYRKYLKTAPARSKPQDKAWIERTTPNG